MDQELIASLRQDLRRSISDPGTRAMLALLRAKQEQLNIAWLDATGDDLLRMQGEAQSVRWALNLITRESK